MIVIEKYEVVKFIDGEFELEVNVSPAEETIWLSQEQIVMLFYTTKQNVSLHIRNILNDGELTDSTVKEILTVRSEGTRKVSRKIKLYNLDMIISIGYRINSKKGIVFRKWANQVLKEYLAGESYDKIAQKLKTDKKSVDNALARIRQKLSVVLDDIYS